MAYERELFVSICTFTVDVADLDAFVEHTLDNASASRSTEPGCLQYDVLVSRDGTPKVTLYEVWTSHDAFVAHHETPHLKRWLEVAAPLVTDQAPIQLQRATR